MSYTYRQSGELQTRTDGANVTTYEYDELANLLSVILPSGNEIEYVIDALDRRIGKKINGMLVQGLVYRDQLHPVAEYDGSGALVSRFVYGTSSQVPDYLLRGGATYRIITDHIEVSDSELGSTR